MIAVYDDFSSAVADDAQTAQTHKNRITIKKSLILATPSPLQEIHANYDIDRAPIGRISIFAKRHPVVAGSMSLFIIGFFALLGLQIYHSLVSIDDNPAFYRYTKNDKLEVYNSQNQLLWTKLGYKLDIERQYESLYDVYKTRVIDIDSDGKNEVISSIQFEPEKTYLTTGITIFDHLGMIKKKYTFPERDIRFRNIEYDTPFVPYSFYCGKNNKNEFFLYSYASNGRSPTFFARLDSNLNIIGRYWNYGQFQFKPIVFPENKEYIALYGKNDVDDINTNDFAMLTILDPELLISEEESSTSRGFGFRRSQSEVYYIRFPENDITQVLHMKQVARPTLYGDSSMFYVNVGINDLNINVSVDYIFNKSDMSVKSIKFNTGIERIHARLKSEGKLQSNFDESYFEKLRNSVEYWDGQKWVKIPQMIKFNSPSNTLAH
ncbi:MAG: hypothetical protein ACYC09_04300 [Bacteroidota bacterium]